jgi:hypothetical protein
MSEKTEYLLAGILIGIMAVCNLAGWYVFFILH